METMTTTRSRIQEVDFDNLGFGQFFSDHMFSMDYTDGAWQSPQILPFDKIEFFPSLVTLHYGQAVFEGLKAFYMENGSVNIFRHDKHFDRLNTSSKRLCIPAIDRETFTEALDALVRLDYEWIPRKKGSSLYIRPFIFATDDTLGVRASATYRFIIITSPVAAYYKEGFNPVRLLALDKYARTVEGGLGAAKTPANYASSLLAAQEAKSLGFTQVLWLDGVHRKYVDEVGTMNIFFLIGDELITPPLGDTILDGVTRDSVIQLARSWGVTVREEQIAINDIFAAAHNGRLKECFGTGTAAVISPVGEIQFNEKNIHINGGITGPFAQKMYDTISGIQYGELPDQFGWRHIVHIEEPSQAL